MTSESPSHKRLALVLVGGGFIVALLTTMAYALHWASSMFAAVADFQGTCPPLPMDGSAYECTVADYLQRMKGGFGAMGAVMEWFFWLAISLILWSGIYLGAAISWARRTARASKK